MSRKYKFLDQDKLYFITFAVVYWIDLFIRNAYKDILIDSWKHCITHKGMELYAYCIMTSHAHMIIGSQSNKMEDIVRDMKRHTSLQLKDAIRAQHSESRREWILWMMEKATIQISNYGNKTITQSN